MIDVGIHGIRKSRKFLIFVGKFDFLKNLGIREIKKSSEIPICEFKKIPIGIGHILIPNFSKFYGFLICKNKRRGCRLQAGAW
jgi:hypothetical protein